MECNKDEAIRAMKLAEKTMQENDFVRAQKFAEKAQRLFPELDNISRLLTVCEVHCLSQVKIGGTEMDWYRILKIEQSVDEATIKKQYRKLALLLHPDKNKFAGAEAAFKLICEANRVLSDQANRAYYDRKYRDLVRLAVQKPSKPQTNVNSYGRSQYGAGNSFQNFPRPQNTGCNPNIAFWTCCPFCKVRYQYYRSCVNKELQCQNCHKQFVAHDFGTQAPGFCQGPLPKQHEVPNQGPQQVPLQVNKGNSSRKRTSNTSKGPQPKLEEENAAKQGVEMPKSGTVKSEKPESSKNVNKKRQRKQAVESSDSEDTEVGDVVGEENGVDSSKFNGHRQRKSSRQKQNVTYQENLSDNDDGFARPPKQSKVSKSSTTGEEELKKNSSFPSEDHCEEKSTADNGPELKSDEASDPESFSYPDPEFHDFDEDRAESCFAANQTWAIYDPEDSMPRFYAIIRTVFSPGSELRITWLEASPNKQDEVAWCNEELPVACGRYKLGSTQKADRAIFSHQMHCIRGIARRTYLVYPRKGETWAIFQNWDIKWSSDPEKHKPFKFDYVEVLSDFDKDAGASVAYLGRVKGFVSLFQRRAHGGVVSYQIPPAAMYCFSHRTPSFRMTGKEREGVPEGSYEFDPASLPASFFNGGGDCGDAKMDDENINAETHGMRPESQESEAERASGFEEIPVSEKHESKNLKKEIPVSEKHESKNSKKEIPAPRKSPRKFNSSGHNESQGVSIDNEKDVKNLGNLTPSKRSATTSRTEEKFNTPKKQESKPEAEAFKLRRSPRDASKNKSEANGSQFTKDESLTGKTQSEKVENSDCSGDIKPNSYSSAGAAKTPLGARSPAAKPPGTPSGKLSLPESFDFTQLKSKENFKPDQIWALRTNGDLFPKTYGQVKKIESTPELRVYVTLLDPSSSLKDVTEPVCCGIFSVKTGRPMLFPLSTFSHCVSAKLVDKKKYEIYPRKGEIWALYKSQNTDSTCPNPSKGECDIVEVLKDHGQSTEVLVLSRFGGSETMFKAPRIQRSKAGIVEIPRAEIARFSHQIPAFRHMGENDSRFTGCWELDPSSTPGGVIC